VIVVFVVFDVILATERLTLSRNSKYGLVVSSTPEGRMEKSLKPAHKPTHARNKTSGRTLQMDAGGGNTSPKPARNQTLGGAAAGGAAGGGTGRGGGACRDGTTIKGRLDRVEGKLDKLVETLTAQHRFLCSEVSRVEYLVNQASAARSSENDNIFKMVEVCCFDSCYLINISKYIQYTGTVTLQQYWS